MRNDRAFCKRCLYELTGLASRNCPECGRPFDPALPRSFTRHPHLRTWGRRGCAALVITLAAYVGSYYCLVQVDRNAWARGGPWTVVSSGQFNFVQLGGSATSTFNIVTVTGSSGSSRMRLTCHVTAGVASRLRFEYFPAYRMGGKVACAI